MTVTIVHISVNERDVDEFIVATNENHKNSIKEKGNLRFDFLREVKDCNNFILYEAYESEEAAIAHKETPHYKKWRETVAPMMKAERYGIPFTVISPADKSLWKAEIL